MENEPDFIPDDEKVSQQRFSPEDSDAYEPYQSKPAKPENDKSFLLYFIIAIVVIIIIGQNFG